MSQELFVVLLDNAICIDAAITESGVTTYYLMDGTSVAVCVL